MIGFLIWILILCLILAVVLWAISLLPFDPKALAICRAIAVLLFLLILLSWLFGWGGSGSLPPSPRWGPGR